MLEVSLYQGTSICGKKQKNNQLANFIAELIGILPEFDPVMMQANHEKKKTKTWLEVILPANQAHVWALLGPPEPIAPHHAVMWIRLLLYLFAYLKWPVNRYYTRNCQILVEELWSALFGIHRYKLRLSCWAVISILKGCIFHGKETTNTTSPTCLA